jgi:hypothetical protein
MSGDFHTLAPADSSSRRLFPRTSFGLLLILPTLAGIDRQDALLVILELFASVRRIEAMLSFRFR